MSEFGPHVVKVRRKTPAEYEQKHRQRSFRLVERYAKEIADGPAPLDREKLRSIYLILSKYI